MKTMLYTTAWFVVVVGLSFLIKLSKSKPAPPPPPAITVTVPEINTFEFHGTPAQ